MDLRHDVIAVTIVEAAAVVVIRPPFVFIRSLHRRCLTLSIIGHQPNRPGIRFVIQVRDRTITQLHTARDKPMAATETRLAVLLH